MQQPVFDLIADVPDFLKHLLLGARNLGWIRKREVQALGTELFVFAPCAAPFRYRAIRGGREVAFTGVGATPVTVAWSRNTIQMLARGEGKPVGECSGNGLDRKNPGSVQTVGVSDFLCHTGENEGSPGKEALKDGMDPGQRFSGSGAGFECTGESRFVIVYQIL